MATGRRTRSRAKWTLTERKRFFATPWRGWWSTDIGCAPGELRATSRSACSWKNSSGTRSSWKRSGGWREVQTLRNYLQHDAASAFGAPLVRGDVATVRRHLEELKAVPEARAVYIALARSAVMNLPVKNRKAMERELKSRE